MCMEDVRLGRQKGTNYRVVTMGAGGSESIAGDLHRTRLRIIDTNNNGLRLAPQDGSSGAGGWATIVGFINEIILDVEHDGQIVTRPFVVLAAAGAVFTVVETSLPKD